MEGYIELRNMVDVPIHMGEFIFTIYDYFEYIRRNAVDTVRLIVDNIGGITGGIKVAHLAECCGMDCVPHNWGTIFDHAAHFQVELASPNSPFFEMTQMTHTGEKATNRVAYPYMKNGDEIVVDEKGYVHAPKKPGLGYEIDNDKLEGMLERVET
jgi:L-alanine-DL-glutamate epimerase-like enolase superfamily enzyme